MKKSILIVIYLLVSGTFAIGKTSHQFHLSYTFEDGLPESSIHDCCQDSFGRIWVATQSGVYVNNGPKFTAFANPSYQKNCSKFTLAVEEDIYHNIWISSSHGIGFHNTDDGHFEVLHELDDVQIVDLDSDSNGNIWMTADEGIWVYNQGTGDLTKKALPINIHPRRLCRINEERLAIISDNGALFLYEERTGSVIPLHQFLKTKTDPIPSFSQIDKINESSLILSSFNNEVFILDLESSSLSLLLSTGEGNNLSMITSMMVYNGEYWIGTSTGTIIYNPITEEIDDQSVGNANYDSLRSQVVLCLFHDKNGNVWAGTFNGGLRCSRNYHGSFGRIVGDSPGNVILGRTTRTICEDDEGYIWTGSDDGVLNRLTRNKLLIEPMSEKAGIIPGTTITAIKNIDGLLWIATFGENIIVFDPKSLSVHKTYSLDDNRCLSLINTSNGDIYIGTSRGLFRKNKDSEEIEHISQVGNYGIHSLFEDSNGNILVGLYGEGLSTFDPKDSSFRLIDLSRFERGAYLKYVNFIGEDEANTIWVGSTDSGLCKIERDRNGNATSFREFSETTGFPFSNVASCVIQDGRMWVETNDGVARLNLSNDEIEKIYFQSDKVVGNNFQEGAYCVTRDGLIFMGSRKGLIYFKPEDLQSIFDNGNLEIFEIRANMSQTSTKIKEEGHSVLTSNKIRIHYNDIDVLEFRFGLSDIESPNRIRYDCQMKGFMFRNDMTTYNETVSYPGIQPGKYTFTVKVHGSMHKRLTRSLTVVILAPWYRSKVALFLYFLALTGVLFLINLGKKKRLEEELLRKEELDNAERQRQLMKDKMDFMTNITHEIKTPVSLISILADKLSREKENSENASDYSSLKNSTNRLFELCNELLEFRKLNDGKIQLTLSELDIAKLASSNANSFVDICKSRGINFRINIPDEEIIANVDKSAVDTIVSNLLSNAVKYCDSEIEIRLEKSEGNARVIVNSDGIRIPKEESEQIFDAFFQSKTINSSGTGLGLTFSRNLAGLQKGSLYLDTSDERHNSFVFSVPVVSSPVPETKEEEDVISEPATLSGENTGKARLLIVEDNQELRKAIRSELRKDYDVKTASNGMEALEIVRNEPVDIVVSDIMMPVMDGCEMCNQIKNDIEYSHILVILLTAATGVESHIKSLQAGADSYIEKPFKMEILKANIRNLLKNRAIRNEQFSHSPLSLVSCNYSSSVEHEFMEKLHETVMDHVSDSEFTAKDLAEMMGTNRKSLISKIKANTGLGISEYIRVCRLRRAAELLAEKRYRVNEVSYLVGYTSPSYFTQQFQAQFGVKPSDFVREK